MSDQPYFMSYSRADSARALAIAQALKDNGVEVWIDQLSIPAGQRWDEAEAALVKLAHADPNRKVYQVYIKRVTDLRMNPPGANWDGVFTFTTK